MANIKEFIKKLKRENPSYITIAELGVHPEIKEKIIGRPILTLQDDVEFWHLAGYDYIKLQPGADFNPAKQSKTPNDEIKLDSTLSFKWATEGKGIITSVKDLAEFKFPSKTDFDYSKFDSVKSLLPNGMGVVGQYGDIFTMTWELMGFESFSFALFENPALIAELNNTLGELVLSMFETMAQHDSVDVLFYSDDIAYTNGLLMPPEVLDSYFFPWLKKIGDLAVKYNKPLIYHSDGILYDVMDKIISCGVDALHPIEPKAMKLSELKDRFGSNLTFIGNIDVDILARGSEEDVRKLVMDNLNLFSYEGSYIVGSSNSIPAYIKVENYLAILATVKDHRS